MDTEVRVRVEVLVLLLLGDVVVGVGAGRVALSAMTFVVLCPGLGGANGTGVGAADVGLHASPACRLSVASGAVRDGSCSTGARLGVRLGVQQMCIGLRAAGFTGLDRGGADRN
ncbi:hypothetical protein ON010_g1797 [Phytophthora cinnamomi]|nr:hypothetical protein ON010_g1797 [Phytophthora cinnamomi]